MNTIQSANYFWLWFEFSSDHHATVVRPATRDVNTSSINEVVDHD